MKFGMTCSSCVSMLERRLKSATGVTDAHIDPRTAVASVEGAAAFTDIINMIEAQGYRIQPI